MSRTLTVLMLALYPLALSAADPSPEPPAKKPVITGKITFKQKPAFPAGTVVEVSVLDVSRADAAATVLGKLTIKDPKTTPIPFAVEYDATQVRQGLMYALGVRISHKGALLYINDTRISVLTNGGGVTGIEAPVIAIRR